MRTLTAVSIRFSPRTSHPRCCDQNPPPPTVGARSWGTSTSHLEQAGRQRPGWTMQYRQRAFLVSLLVPPFRFSSTRAVNGGFGIASETGDTNAEPSCARLDYHGAERPRHIVNKPLVGVRCSVNLHTDSDLRGRCTAPLAAGFSCSSAVEQHTQLAPNRNSRGQSPNTFRVLTGYRISCLEGVAGGLCSVNGVLCAPPDASVD